MNEKGFITTTLLILLPLMLAGLALASTVAFVMGNDSEAKHLCRLNLLSSQEAAARKLKQLMDLNPKARQLRRERERAERDVILATGNPAREPMALAKLAAVIAKQTALSIQQNILVAEGKRVSAQGPTLAKTAVTRSLTSAMNLQTERVGARPHASKMQTGLFDVVARPSDSPTPDYEPSEDFSFKQTTRIKIRIPVKALLPDWLSDFLKQGVNLETLNLETSCVSTIEKEDGKWLAKLKADKL